MFERWGRRLSRLTVLAAWSCFVRFASSIIDMTMRGLCEDPVVNAAIHCDGVFERYVMASSFLIIASLIAFEWDGAVDRMGRALRWQDATFGRFLPKRSGRSRRRWHPPPWTFVFIYTMVFAVSALTVSLP